MVRDEQVFGKGCRGNNRIGPFHALKRGRPSLLRRDLLGDVMVMVMMAKECELHGVCISGAAKRTGDDDDANAS